MLDQEQIHKLGNLTERLGQMTARLEYMSVNNDTFFLCSMAIVIFLMQCGFAFLEAGSVRSKNTTNILIKNLIDSCISSISYWLIGYGLAFGDDRGGFIGGSKFLLIHLEPTKYAWFFFQFVFAANASTIVSGALAERCEFVAFVAYCAFQTGFVYPVLSHWAWTEKGWLAAGGYKDFAGSGVVHLHGGVSALVGAIILGPRIGRYHSSDYPKQELKGHSVPFAAMGGFLLMFGFFAFNGGSMAHISQDGDAESVSRAMVATMMCGGWAAISVLVANKFILKQRKWSLLLAINAVLAGMVSACAGGDAMEAYVCPFMGVGAGGLYLLLSFVVEKCKIDDPMDAVAVHAGGGLWGLLASPFVRNDGIFYNWDRASGLTLGWNVVGALVITAWSAVLMGGLFYTLRLLRIFRVDPEVENKGLDIFKHGEAAYPVAAYGHGWIEADTPSGRVRKLTGFVSKDNPVPMVEVGFENLEKEAMSHNGKIHLQ